MGETSDKEEDWPEKVFLKWLKRKCKFDDFCFSLIYSGLVNLLACSCLCWTICTLFVRLYEPVKLTKLLCVSHS